MRLRPARLVALFCFAALPAAAGAAPAPSPWPVHRLIVVIWERRAPQTPAGTGAYGAVQRTNREELVSLLYNGAHPLAGTAAERKNTSIAVYPEGLPSHDANADVSYASLGQTSPEHLADIWLPQMLSIGATEAPAPVFFGSAPEKDAFDRAIRDRITYPLVGLTSNAPDESFGTPNERATRAVSHPPLVTPYAIYDAASRTAAPHEPFSEVSVIWVHAGERNYAITIPFQMIQRDYGPNAASYYRASRLLYSITPDVTHTSTGELADGDITVWKVRRLIENADPIAPVLMAHGLPATLDKRGPTVNLSRFPHGAVHWLRQFRVAGVADERWQVACNDPRFRPVDAVVRMQRSGKVYPLPSPAAPIPAGRIALEADGDVDTTEWNVSDTLIAEVRFEPAEKLPDYLQRIAVSIPTRMVSPPAPITLAITAFPRSFTDGVLFLVAVGVLYLLIRTVRRFGKRSLALHVEWAGPQVDEIKLRGPDTEHIATARLWLLDQSSFKPVARRKLNVVLTGDAAITELPLRTSATALSHFVHDGHRSSQITVAVAPSRSPSGDGTPIQIRFDPSAVDYTRLHAGREISGAYSFAVEMAAAGRYRALRDHKSQRYRVDVQAFPPKYIVDGQLLEQIDRDGLFFDPKLTEPQTERRKVIGWVFVNNPPVEEGTALDIAVVGPVTASARIFAGDDSHKVDAIAALRSAGRGAGDEITIANGGQERWDVYVTIPSITDWSARTAWTITVDVGLHVRVAGSDDARSRTAQLECTWYPVNKNDFVCIDLGTSATRLLIQGSDDARYGFLPFPDAVRGPLSAEPEDLPAICNIEGDRVFFGYQALGIGLDPSGFRMSLKQRILEERAGSTEEIELYLQKLLTEFYQGAVHESARDRVVELRQPRPDGTADLVPVMRGPRHLAVCSVPNEALPALRTAYKSSIMKTGLFRRVELVREAEAVALDYIDRRHQMGGPGETLNILALDIGAGTSDAALVTAELPPDNGDPSAVVVAAAGVPRAGRHIDRQIFEIVAAHGRVPMKRDFAALDAVTSDHYLRQCEDIKKAMSAGLQTVEINFEGVKDLDDLESMFNSAEYQKALYDIVDVPLKMLFGRMPAAAAPARVSHLLLTGRGSLIRGVRERFLAATAAIRAPECTFENASGNPGMLKAAVTFGARSLARKQWRSLHLSTERFPDRVLLLAVNEKGAVPIVVIDAGHEYPRRGGIHEEVPLDWTHWKRAAVIRTYLRPDASFGRDLHLDEEACRQVLGGRPVGPFARSYTLLQELRLPTKRRKRDWFAVVDINRDGEVSVREEAR